MSLTMWGPEFEMGLDKMDAQHRGLFDAINALFDAMQKSKGIEEVSRTLAVLHEYTVFHFGEEEALMEHHDYPDLRRHQRLHVEWVAKITQLEQKRSEGSFLVAIELLRFLSHWLATHIKEEDRAFSNFLRSRGQL